MIIYVTTSQRDWLRKTAASRGQSRLLLACIENAETAGELGKVIREQQQPDTSGLFERPKVTRGDLTQISLRMNPRHLEVIDRLVARHQAPNRSALARAAIVHAQTHPRRRS